MKKSDISSNRESYTIDAFVLNGEPILYKSEMEGEQSFSVRKVSVKKADNNYIVKKKIYYGYWGRDDGKTSNYQITYKVRKNKKSRYGYVITAMNVKHL